MKTLTTNQLEKLSTKRLEALCRSIKNSINFFTSAYANINFETQAQNADSLRPLLREINRILVSRKELT